MSTLQNQNLSFAEATKVTPSGPNTYEANLPLDWSIGSVPHGGYLTALFLTVANTHFTTTLSSQNQPHTIALHLTFLRKTDVGPATLSVSHLKLGRQTSVINITLSQSSVQKTVCTLTQSNISSETGRSFSTKWALNPAPLPVDLKQLSKEGECENWVIEKESEMRYLGFRKATHKTEFAFPRGGQKELAWADEWVRLRSGERWTNASVGYLADTWPMPVESFLHANTPSSPQKGAGKFWYPTLLLNLDVKKSLPEEGVEWLFARVDTKQVKNGRMDIDLVIMDEEGDIVALSTHVALAVDVERNTKSAGKNGGSKI